MGRIAKITDELSPEARIAMADGFAQQWPAARIAQAVLDATGERIAERTVQRRAAEWRMAAERRKLARERMDDLVAAMKGGGMEASEMIQALAMDRLVENPEALTGGDPLRVQTLSLQAEELRLKRRQIEVRERAIAVEEKRFGMLEAREARALAALEDKGETMTADERVQRIREIYGLANQLRELRRRPGSSGSIG